MMNVAGWVLILFAHVGPMGNGNSNALSTAQFTTKERCEAAGKQAASMASGTVKSIEYRCAQQ